MKGYQNKNQEFRYFTMPFADDDLSGYLSKNNLSLFERSELCLEICESLSQLNNQGFYHRDIKPDNILFVNGSWYISDLGLVDNRDNSFDIDEEGEWIGPRGWMSQESMNKFLAEKRPWSKNFNCKIDHQSDIFQLGKVMWYIFQGNSPEGAIKRNDFLWKNDGIYQIIRTMINSSKKRRVSEIEKIIISLKMELKKITKSNTFEKHLY